MSVIRWIAMVTILTKLLFQGQKYKLRLNSKEVKVTAITSSEYVKTALKYSRFLAASKITVDEYAKILLSSCALLSEFDGTTTQAVAVSVPELARRRLDQEIATVFEPDYRFPELHFGGPGPSQEVREEMRRLYEKRIRAFAAALATALGPA